MNLAALEKRVRALEALPVTTLRCRCRAGRSTLYHTPEELKTIMDIRCPVHGFRDLGYVGWVASGLPLRPEDQHLCSCPPSPVRQFLRGRRGPLSEAEQEEEERKWMREITPESHEDFRREHIRAKRLLQQYEYNKSKRRRNYGEDIM